MLLGLAVQSALAEDHEDPSFGTATLDQVAALYGLDRAGAEKRLLAEIQAAETQRRIEGRRPVSYAGSWFDGASLKLMVAITDPEDASRVQSAGAIPTVVNWSMTELDAAFDQAEALRHPRLSGERVADHHQPLWQLQLQQDVHLPDHNHPLIVADTAS